MKIKKFLLPIWWYNRDLFPRSNKCNVVFVLNGLRPASSIIFFAENQQGVNAVQWCSVENHKGAIAIVFVQQ